MNKLSNFIIPFISLIIFCFFWEFIVWVNNWPNYKMASQSDLGPAFWKFKWLFLIGLIFNFPLGINQFLDVDWASLPLWEAVLPMIFVVVGTTCMTYFLNGYALSKITSTEVAVFMYLQPIIGILFAIFTKSDTITLIMFISSILIFTGVYLTSVLKQKK